MKSSNISQKNKITVDYQDFTYPHMSEIDRRILGVGDIWSNRIRCKLCDEIIRSKNNNDMVYCKCGNASVDGGSWYSIYGAKNLGMIEILIEYYHDANYVQKI